jgi:hypothetical protein
MDSVSKGSNQSDESGGGIMDKGLLRPDPEVSEKKKNRYFTAQYKMRILTRESIRNLIAIAAFLFALTGCATTANYEKILNSWKGATELDLVRKWGPPQRTYRVGSHQFIVYISSRNIPILGTGTGPSCTTTAIGDTAYTDCVNGTPERYIHLYCQTTFEILGDRIIGWRWQGNDCTALK